LFVALYAIISAWFKAPLCFWQITHLVISKPTAFSLFQLVWHFLKRFGIFLQAVWHFFKLGPGNPDILGRELKMVEKHCCRLPVPRRKHQMNSAAGKGTVMQYLCWWRRS